VARINAVLRRVLPDDNTASPVITIGDLEIDHRTRSVKRGQDNIELTLVEFALLEKLINARGRIVSREDLVRDVLHRPLSPFDRSMDTHVANLRRKLGHQVNGVERIKTVRSIGYIYADTAATGDLDA
jgi:two-component system response regulator CpxR